jgi:hypothetical protein
MTKWVDDDADAQLAEQEHVQQFLEPRLNRAAQTYNQALKSLWLGNAGAALATMSFIGATWRSNAPPRFLLVPFGFFIVGLIAMGVGELTNLVTESRAIRRIQDARSIADVPFQYVETPAENVGLHLSPRTLLALISGGCFVAGVTIGFVLIVTL